jgi:hypothetical protein
MDRLIAVTESGESASKAVGPTIAERQKEIDRLDHDIAVCDAEISNAAMASSNAEYVIEKLRGRLAKLDQESWECQRDLLNAIVWEVELAQGKDLRMTLRWPMTDLGGDGGGTPPGGGGAAVPATPGQDAPNTRTPRKNNNHRRFVRW